MMHVYLVCGYDTMEAGSATGVRVHIFGTYLHIDGAKACSYLRGLAIDPKYNVYRGNSHIYWIIQMPIGTLGKSVNVSDGSVRCKIGEID